jgi:hypothetical protein
MSLGDAKGFEGYLNGTRLRDNEWFAYTTGGTLTAEVLPEERWPEAFSKPVESIIRNDGLIEQLNPAVPAVSGPIHLYLFRTPVSEYEPAFGDPSKPREPRTVDLFLETLALGSPTMVEELDLESGFIYDVVATGMFRGTSVPAGLGRVSTHDVVMPGGFTIEQIMMFALRNADVIHTEKKLSAKMSVARIWEEYQPKDVYTFKFSPGYSVSVDSNGILRDITPSPVGIREHLGVR